ncbi:MAG: TonB-dependent receptor [Acidobacteria bacterium]|nr:TonB-dependent receptor [Acidobacteriota bacterium]
MNSTHNRRTTGSWLTALVAIVCLLFGAATMQAQFETASVLGYVRDNSGAAIPNATVTLTNVATNVSQTAKTDGEGKYEFNSIQIGNYTISTEAAGFQGARTEQFKVLTNARQRVDVSVKPGAVSEVVEVSSAAQLLETETSSRGTVIETRQVENLPLNGRSYADLVLLVPGARKSTLENNGTSSREASFNINGQRSAFNNFLLDGLDNNNYGTSNQGFANENIPPSPDAVSEFKVEVDNYSAEYGRNPGAVINVSTRRGTNQYHGKAYDYVRNDAFNAIGPFLATGARKPKFIRNQFGGTFGMPIWKDHTFFFGDYEGLRQIFGNANTVSTLPTAAQRSGDFSAIGPIRNPITGTVYANGIVPASDQTAFAKAVLAALPLPNAGGNNYAITPRGEIKDDKGDGRVDHTFNQKWTIFGRFSEHRGYIFDPPGIPGRAGGNSNGNVQYSNRAIATGVTWTISANKLLDVRFGWSQNKGGKFPIGVGHSSLLTENGITHGLPTDPLVVRDLNDQNVTGFSQFGTQPSNPQFQNPTVFNPKVNFTWVKGKHTLKLGYEFQAIHTEVNDFNPSYGQDNYAGQYSRPCFGTTPCASATGTAQQAYNLADFMFGNRSSYSLTTYAVVNLRQRYNFMYIQDDMKLSPKLTVNAGLRYEIVTPQWERDNRLANFDPATKTLVQAKNGSVADRAQVNTPKNNFGPRFGFSYQAHQDTVIRGGYGIVYTQWNRAGGENNLTYNGPNVVNASITQVAPTAASLCTNDTQLQSTCFRQTQQGYAENLTSPAYFNPAVVTSRYIPRDFKTGYVQQYHLGIQQKLPGGIVMDLAYVGNKGTHLQILADYNQAIPCIAGNPGCVTTAQQAVAARRPISTFGTIEIAYGAGTSNYNSLQLKTEKRAGSLYLLNSFTWGRVFDLSSGHLETGSGDNSRVNYYNPSQDYGPGGYDQPLADTLSMLYDLPYGHGRRFGAHSNAVMNSVLGGWQLSVINNMTSGIPINVTYSLSSSNPLYVTDIVTYRPNRVQGVKALTDKNSRLKTATSIGTSTPGTGYFNPNAFSTPTTYPWGTERRNQERGYAFFQTDLGIHKAFPLWSESSKLDFRAEAFNVLNKVNYSNPNTTFGGTTFGQITTTAGNPRQLQLAAKLIF